jgi:tRNA pseudouridine55 synthase
MMIRRSIEERFIGHIEQEPPAHSAVHINGERAYDLARKGETVHMPKRMVDIHVCEIISYEYPNLTLRVACGSGTYIRSLAHDLGTLMRCGGYLNELRRTKVGDWNIEDAVAPEKAVWTDVTPLKDILAGFRSVELDAKQTADIQMGKKIPLVLEPDTVAWFDGLPIAILVPSKDGTQTTHARKVL